MFKLLIGIIEWSEKFPIVSGNSKSDAAEMFWELQGTPFRKSWLLPL